MIEYFDVFDCFTRKLVATFDYEHMAQNFIAEQQKNPLVHLYYEHKTENLDEVLNIALDEGLWEL